MDTKRRTSGYNVCGSSCGLNVSEDYVECESFIIISSDSLLVHKNKYYLQVNLDSCAYETVDEQKIDILMKISIFMLINESCITILQFLSW